MPEGEDGENQALDPIAYLSRSENRLQVLESLTADITKPGQETTGFEPRELRGVTNASEATVSRILSEFQERGWVERNTEGEYVSTPQAAHLANAFRPLIESVETIQTLGDVVAVIPIDELTIGLHHFHDATVVRYQPSDQGVGQPLTEMYRSATAVDALTWYTPPLDVGLAMEEAAESRELGGVSVVTPSMIRSVADNPGGPPDWAEFIDSEQRPFYVYDGHLPCNLFISEDTVLIENSGVDGIRIGTWLKSENETVRRWGLEVIDRYREQAEEVTAEDLLA